ncbi:MAG: hypothetical protein ABIJ43_04345 [Candidatus Beckwithbacteria bacterium]|nr:hypothetical protein [Patescibacteria group bacterium]
MKRYGLTFLWFATTTFTLFLTLSFYTNISNQPNISFRPTIIGNTTNAITSHAILPQVLGSFTYKVKSNDAIPEIVKKYLEKYDSPLLPYSNYLVKVARDYSMDPRLLIAIAQQESNLCKKIPEGTYNCWGWGIHSQGTLGFDNYKQAIDTVTKGISQNYLGKGLITPTEIMAIYTPLSDGSWAKGVQQFLDEMN